MFRNIMKTTQQAADVSAPMPEATVYIGELVCLKSGKRALQMHLPLSAYQPQGRGPGFFHFGQQAQARCEALAPQTAAPEKQARR